MGWYFGLLTFMHLLVVARTQTPCSMASTITVTLDEGNVTANQVLDSTSPYQASLPVTGTLGVPTGITLIMTSDNLLAPNPNNTFRIEDIGTGTRIRLITSVDRDGAGFTNLDDTEIISFQLKCTSNADTSTTTYATINVNIRDVNDNSPQFINKPYFLSVEELMPVGTTIYRQISALDKDDGLAATIDYTLPAGDGSLTDGTRKFNFTSTRFPNLIITQSLDFEPMYALGQTTYVMNVIAKDLGTPPLSSVAQVNVTVTDSDDMAPAFVYANCLLSGIYCVDPRYSTSVVSGQITNPLIIYPLVGFTRQTATTIRAVDRDTLRSPLTFRIAGTSPVGYETYFSVAGSGPVSSGDKDVYTATLTQLQFITRSSTLTRVEVYILATQANLKYEERATVSVEIDVPNNSPPTVTTATGVNTGYIYENSHLGQNVLDGTTSSAKPLQLIVTDPDDSISGQKTTFSFSATGTGLFNVDSNGYIYLASGNLDYETTKSATINVRVTETNTAERRSTDVSVTIQVLDLNDNDPVFTSTGAVHVSVPEGDYTLSSRLLAQVDATDADSGVNRILVYSIMSIEPTVPSGFFTINTNTGDVSLSGRVTYPSDYVVVVKASDSAVLPDTIRSATKNLYVNVTSAGNNAPQIPSTLYTITISEGTVSGTSIFTVPARDPDGQVLSYTITAGNAAGQFSIDSSGQLRTAGSLDREVTPTYGLTVTVRDTTTPLPLSATTTVSVILTDVNDNSPVFTNQYQLTVLENQPAGISVGTVTATDADQPSTVNSELTYSLKLANNFFAINPSSGQITTLQTLDYESQSQYIFEVLAVDRASDSRTGTVSVTVFVTDVQDSVPLFTQQIFTASVAEGNANAYVVFVSAVDADAVDNIQYRILSPATATFNINSASGQINTAVALDYETQKYYEFFVTTVDGQGSTNPSSTATVQVTVLDQNDNSPILSLPVASVQVFEDAEVNRVLVTVSATDADAANTTNSEIRFSIVSVTPTSGSSFFSIDRDYGQLVIERSLTNDQGVNQYQILIRASDRGTPVLSSQATFTVNVTRNTAPLFNPSSVTVRINHNIATTTTVSSIQAVDTDPGDYGRLNYLLLGDSIASHYFQLVPAGNGVNIITIDQLTKDTSRTYYLTITAKDNAGIVSKTATATVTVNVNRNLQDPRWLNLPLNLQTTISITENDPLGQAVFTLSAEDLDILSPDNQVEFRLTGNTQAQNYFRIDSIGYNGVISVIRSPVQDRTINQFTLTVSLTDKGVPPRSAGTATVFVNVLRNDQPPMYFNSTYYVQLREDVAVSTNVVQVSATDSDTNSNFNQITYRIIGDDTAPNFFTIVSSGGMAGQITTSGNLASDSTDIFRIRVEATDNGAFPRKATALVFVKVLRNFNSPLWTLNQLFGSVTIPENQNLDSVIYTLPLATDRDSTSPNNITNYRLTNSTPSQGQNYYQVNAATGEVTIKKDLTRDPGVTPYRLTFQAYDLGTPSLTGTQTFTLTVNVYRNTPPVFSPSIYNVSVDETRNVNSNILTLSATDSDAVSIPGGLFSQLNYRIANPASALPYFSVLVDNGQMVLRIVSLLTNAPLDKYLLIVQVTDDGGLSNYAEVTVDIRRNLNAPQFTQTSYVVNITEDHAVGSGIRVTVLATDSDLRSPYRDVTYFETGQPVSLPYFDVNPSSGEVTVARPLTDGTASQYIYTISARDGGNLQPTNFVTVTINVFHNLNPPVIINLPDRRPVAKTTNLGVVIFTVRATDADTVVPFNTLSYSLVAGDMSAFSINGNGNISVATNLTAYGKAELQVVAQVCDGGTNRRCDSEILTLVVDSNLNEPVFIRPGALDGFRAIVTVRENIDSTYTVYDVDAMDADTSSPFNDLTYTLTGLGTGPTYFGISPTDGRITIRLSLLQDTAIQYNLTVIVRDGGSPPRQAAQTGTIVVNVIRNNNAPQWQNLPQTQVITQSSGINNIVYTANAIDSDQVFNVVTYSIAGVGTAPSFFTINPNTGIVTLTGDIRTVSDTTFYLLIRASDNGTPPKSTDSVLTILVQRNEFSPNFVTNSEVFSLRIPETQTIGVAISRVNATDQDNLAPYNMIEYYVIGDTLASIYFNVNSTSGEIFVKFPLQSDPANTQIYTLTIQARDGGSPSRISVDTARVTIEVYRNLNAPRFTLVDYITSINETTPVGIIIFLLTFFDSDTDAPFNTMSLTAIGDGLSSSVFNVDNTGRVTTNRNLTLESANTYQLRVQVHDGGSPSKSGTTVLTIQVQRNLLAPVFVPALYNTTILETRDTGDIILTVTAIDADTKPPNNIVHYSISSSTSSDIGRQYFMINEATGGISLRKSAMSDTNRATLYTYQIYAYDGGNPSQKSNNIPVTISIIRNQFPPEILNLPSQINITSSYLENDLVFTLQYRDNDTQAPFNTISTEIVGVAPTSDLFKINPVVANQASILMNRDANTGTQMNYYIWIRARDGGSPSKTIEALLKVTRNCDPDNNKSVSCVTETNWNLTVECPEDRYSIVDIMITNAGNISNGSPVNITCMIRVVKNVTPTITWKYDGTVMKPVTGSRISISDITVNPKTPQRISQTMSFKPIQSSDSGTYECVVTDDNLPPSVKNKTVTVLSQPEIFIKPVTQTVDAGSTVNISCEVKHNVLITRMFWYRNGTNINSTNKLSEETFSNGTTTNIHVLTHRNIKYTTRYECRGENDAGQGNMQQAIIYVVLPGSQPGETCKTENDTRGTEWSRTLQDTPDKKPCPSEMSGEAVRYCLHGGVWSNPSYDNCIKNTLLDQQKLIDKIKNGLAPNIVPDALVNLTGLTNPNTVELNKAEVQVVSNILNDVIQISNNTNITDNDVENFLEIASNLIDVKNSPAWQALIIDGKEGATTVLQNVEEYNRIKAKSINSADEPVKRFTRKNLFVEIGYNPVSDIQFPNTTANGSAFINGSSFRFVLSRDALNNGYYTSYSCAYFNNVSGLIQRSKTNTGADLEINSAVLSLQLDPPPPPLLSPPLILTFKHFSTNYSKPVCSYWVFIAPGSGKGAWSSNGCNVVSTSDYTTVCECNHLTNFAILMSPGKTRDKDQVPLSIISIIGCAISIFCLSVTMIAHFIVWRYVKSDRTSLLMNLCLALIISYIIFLAGVDRTENKGVCIAVAALLHYFYLAVFFLMLTYGIELAVSVIYVFVTRSRIQWLLPLAWSLPAVVVAISLGVTKLEGYGNEKFCWLSIKDGLIWAFVGPAALVTLVNFIIILVVFKHMFSSSTMMTKSDKDKAKTTVRSLCVLLPITGITWVFGILSVNEDLVVFQYLFAIINSLQGLFISLFHCFFNHNLRQAIKQINAKRKRSLVTYSTTPKISSNSSGQIKDIEERHDMIRAVPVNQEDQMIIPREERHEMIRAVPVNQEDQMIITRL